MLSHLVCVAMLAISFHGILCYYLPGNITMPDSLLQDCEITLVISPVASIRNHYASCQGQLIHKQLSNSASRNRGAFKYIMDNSTQNRTPGRYGIEEIESRQLEAWPNPNPERDYVVHFEIPEFTCLRPRSGFPDFATIVIDYVPGPSVVELKSLKLYINAYRNRQISHESTANT